MKADYTPPEDRNATALLILDAADDLLTEVGFEGLSVRAVAARAKVQNPLVFYYFGSKAGLVERVIARYYARQLAALERAMAGEGPLADKLHRLIDAYVSFIEDNRRYPRLVQHQLAGPEAFRQRIQENLAPLLAWTRSALAELAPATGPTGAHHLFVTISAAVINYYTYAEVLAPMWGADPLDQAALAERRAHLHWLVDALMAAL
ncbi:MAG: TetR/AcrR family transcriptional regulator [Deltaproteobacteria bacterium]|nr:TetR/AcrR family transcriptional regulator [Deltaproteobacteria bacterium]